MKNTLLLFLVLFHFLIQAQSPKYQRINSKIDSLNTYILELLNQGKYQDALPLAEEATILVRENMPTQNPVFSKTISYLENIYQETSQLGKAELLLQELLSIAEKNNGRQSLEYAKYLHQFGQFYSLKSEFSSALVYLKEALSIKENLVGKKDHIYAFSLGAYAEIIMKQGDFEEAERLLLAQKDIYNLEEKPNSHKADNLQSLADLYSDLGVFAKSEAFYLQSLEMQNNLPNKNLPQYATTLSNFATLYQKLKEFEKAQKQLLEAREIYVSSNNTKHHDYPALLQNLAINYCQLGDLAEGEKILNTAKEASSSIFGKENDTYMVILNNLGTIAFLQQNYPQASTYYREAKQIYESVSSTENWEYPEILCNLGITYEANAQTDSAAVYYLKANTFLTKHILDAADFCSEAEMLGLEASYASKFFLIASLAHAHPEQNLSGTIYNNALLFKNAMLEKAVSLEKWTSTASPATLEIYYKWKNCHVELAENYAKPLKKRENIAKLEAQSADLEKILVRNQAAFTQPLQSAHWQEVQSKLQPTEAAIEFIRYVHDPIAQPFYSALVLLPDGLPPHLVPLCTADTLEGILRKMVGARPVFLQNLYAAPNIERKKASLYELIWQPILPILENVKTVYFAPTGSLHRVNFDAIAINTSQTLKDNYELISLNSTRDLIHKNLQTNYKTVQTAAVFGGIKYEMDSTALRLANAGKSILFDEKKNLQPTDFQDIAARGGYWKYLEGAAKESTEIHAMLQKSNIHSTLFQGMDASEENLISIGKNGQSPMVLHLATHGFFFPDDINTKTNENQEGIAFKSAENPMMRVGLLFSGANYAWKTGQSIAGAKDGILTAYEVSLMDLSNTALVVLSACETGLGEIESNEGVFGLQRAFKLAGAKYVLMSLWSVPDDKTHEMMAIFYQFYLEKGMTIPDAFRATQEILRKKYPNPYLWAGFVLV
jgi:CHAT domain-containing protein